MGITRLNHAVLYVPDADAEAAFYVDVLGFEVVNRMSLGGSGEGVFLRAPASSNDHDLALFGLGDRLGPSTAGRDQVGLYHLAWEVPTLAELAEHRDRLVAVGALRGASDHGSTKALYAVDPAGVEFEVSWIVPVELLTDADRRLATSPPAPLDLAADASRFGADLPGQATYVR